MTLIIAPTITKIITRTKTTMTRTVTMIIAMTNHDNGIDDLTITKVTIGNNHWDRCSFFTYLEKHLTASTAAATTTTTTTTTVAGHWTPAWKRLWQGISLSFWPEFIWSYLIIYQLLGTPNKKTTNNNQQTTNNNQTNKQTTAKTTNNNQQQNKQSH